MIETIAKMVMVFKDALAAVLMYLILSFVLGHQFNWWDPLIILAFAYGPDTDFVPFFLLKKKLNLWSHWVWHYPLVFTPVCLLGLLLVLPFIPWFEFVGEEKLFYGSFFFIATMTHFLFDTPTPRGVQWFWPLSDVRITYDDMMFRRATYQEIADFEMKMKVKSSDRSVWDELMMRTFKRKNFMDRKD